MQLAKPDPIVLAQGFDIDGTEGNDNSQLNEPPNLVGTGVTDRIRGRASCPRSRCNVRMRRHRTAGLANMGRFVRGDYRTAAI